jgi:hypothetical protein
MTLVVASSHVSAYFRSTPNDMGCLVGVVAAVREACKPGAKLVDIAELGDDLIEECVPTACFVLLLASLLVLLNMLRRNDLLMQGMWQGVQGQECGEGDRFPDLLVRRPVRIHSMTRVYGLSATNAFHMCLSCVWTT